MQSYLDMCNGNKKKALALYVWHAELTSAVQSVLGITEVMLRNAMDRELRKWYKDTGTEDWLLDLVPRDPVNPRRHIVRGGRQGILDVIVTNDRERAYRRAVASLRGRSVGHDDVLAQTMFGSWEHLLPIASSQARSQSSVRRNQVREQLWDECFCFAFPGDTSTRGAITFGRVNELHLLRNRVSHMEHLFNTNIERNMQTAFALLESIDPDLKVWVSSVSRVGEVLSRKPSL
ncbi:hypothetical protein BM477_05555 [Boudabousia marimammalium]|uniref:Abi-like protein n=2 Tax=Boudabousia marimammalium TaxID=156892 RepID=A0A1Q5PMQ9_9ACTO|nr:hypothetical protein BM477_05555 [Boudabousia marimammalium]